MQVSEAINLDWADFRRPIELTGYLIVSSHLACIVEDQAEANSDAPLRGVLIERSALKGLEEAGLPTYVGSSVRYAGNIALKGTITDTGIALLPCCIPYVYEYRFEVPGFPPLEVKVGDVAQDVFLRLAQPASLPIVRALKPWFDPNLATSQLRNLLESSLEHQLAQRAQAAEVQEITQLLDKLGLSWRLEVSEINRGEP